MKTHGASPVVGTGTPSPPYLSFISISPLGRSPHGISRFDGALPTPNSPSPLKLHRVSMNKFAPTGVDGLPNEPDSFSFLLCLFEVRYFRAAFIFGFYR